MTRHNSRSSMRSRRWRRIRRPAAADPAATFGTRRRLWDELHPTPEQQRELYHWLLERPDVLTGDSFFHLSALGEPLPGLNLCGAGRVVCLIDPVGDVYACPFVMHDEFKAGNVREPGGSRPSGGSPNCSPRCVSRAPGPVPRAAPTTPVVVAAWPRSSSPACR